MKVSVVIPCYNHGKTIESTVSSCCKIKIEKEIIVINDGSKDNTKEILEKIPDIILINQENKGPGSARNTGIAAAKNDFIILIDADDFFLDGVNALFNYIEEYDIVYGNVYNSTGKLDKLLPEDQLTNELFEKRNPMTTVFLFKKKVWTELGGFSEKMMIHEDWDFLAKAFFKKFKFKYVDANVFLYNRSNTGLLGTRLRCKNIYNTLTLENIKQYKNKDI